MTHQPHILIVTETWLHSDISDDEITPPGYGIHRKDRNSRGGGVAIIYQQSLLVSKLPDIPAIECVIIKVQFDEHNLIVGGFYRPPTQENFFSELNEFLCSIQSYSCNVLLGGDFNMPSINWSSDFPEPLTSKAEPFVDLVIFHDLAQLVKVPTRIQNETASILDLFLVSNAVLNRNPEVHIFDGISDHKMISLTVQLRRTTDIERKKKFRSKLFAR